MTELLKFSSDDAWDNLADDVTDEEVKKAETSTRFLQKYEGVLTVKSARHVFSEKAKGDPKFHQFVVTLEAPDGAIFEYKNYFSFVTAKYGTKGTMFFGIRLKSLFRALGFDELHLSTASAEAKARAVASQKKYLGRWEEDGTLARWEGLKVFGRIGYPTGSLHLVKNGDVFTVVDAEGKPKVFDEIKAWDDAKNDWAVEKGVTVTNPSKDQIKVIAGNNGFKLSYPELLATQPIAGANDALLTRFSSGGEVKSVGPTDAHSQVQKAEAVEDEPF
jgi:hypothetical protein